MGCSNSKAATPASVENQTLAMIKPDAVRCAIERMDTIEYQCGMDAYSATVRFKLGLKLCMSACAPG